MEEIRKFLRIKNEESSKAHVIKSNNYFYASEALKCPRQIYYSRIEPKEIDDKLLGTFCIGETIHQLFQKVLKEARTDLKDEVEIRIFIDDLEISGRADLMGDKDIYELKTTSNIKYNETEPSQHHIGQITLYLSQNQDKKAHIVYIDKRDLRTAEHDVEFDEITFKAIINNFKKVKEALDNKIPPDKLEKETWECRYCPWHDDKCIDGGK